MNRHNRRRWELRGIIVGVACIAILLTVYASTQNMGHTQSAADTTGDTVTGKIVKKLSSTSNATDIKKARRLRIIKQNLQSYLDKVTSDGTASVSFYSLDSTASTGDASQVSDVVSGAGTLSVNSNAHTWVTAASTYKLYIAAYLLHQRQLGNYSWTNTTRDGFERMIVESANDYPESVLSRYGESNISRYVKSAGWGGPVFTEGSAAVTTAYSLRLLLTSLANGTGAFSNTADRNYLLNLMGKQEYRAGIPAGVASVTKGATVQDKVGFLDDTNSDAGIVTLPSGQRYVMVILTHGRNQATLDFARIKTIAAKVQTIVYGKNAGTKLENVSAD